MPRDPDPDAVVAAPNPSRPAEPAGSDRPSGPDQPGHHAPASRPGRPATIALLSIAVAGIVGFGVAVLADRTLFADDPAGPAPTATGQTAADPAAGRSEAVDALLVQRATAVTEGNRELFLSTVDTGAEAFYAAQATMFDRLTALELARWSYQVTGAGPALEPERAAQLPPGSAIVQVRLTYLLTGTDTVTDRVQYLTVAPDRGRWRFVSDTDGEAAGSDTQRDLWDLGPVVVRRGDTSLVLADSRGADADRLRRLADEADDAVRDVDRVWNRRWSRTPIVVLPQSQSDMAALIGITEEGLGQIAAVTTGSFESGLSRGDRVVINPAAWDTLGSLGRRVVLTHEMTHVATRATSVQPVPIWLSEGFADYVAYQASPVPVSIVAAGVLDDVRDGNTPETLPGSHDFDATEGDVATSYEGAWLACRMIAEEYSEKRLVRLYATLSDNKGTGWPAELHDVLGIREPALVRDWRDYLRTKAAA